MPPLDFIQRLAVVPISVALTLPACGRDDPPVSAPVLAAPSASAPPVDRLAPDELAEGKDSAFGLRLPRNLHVRYRGPFEVHAEGKAKPDHVANYIRKRVKAPSVELGASKTIFDQARVVDQPKGALLRIEVIQLPGATRLVIHDLSERKVDRTQPASEIWRTHGFSEDGKKFDTEHVE